MKNSFLGMIATASILFLLSCSPKNVPQVSPTPTNGLPVSISPTVEPSATVVVVAVPTPSILAPAPSGELIQILAKPFLGDFPIFNFFDHNFPFEFRDTNGYQVTWWGEKTSGLDGHDGLDFLIPEGTQILAAGEGVVVRSGVSDPFYCPPLRRTVSDSLGIEISHKLDDGTFYMTSYFHLSKTFVELNQTVKSGQLIGLSGNSGCSTKAHLHFTVGRFPARNGKRVHVDPFGWSGESPDPWADHKDGSNSLWLWKEGKAPLIYREETNQPSQTSTTAKVKIGILRWMGWKDSENPNNEFVQLELTSLSSEMDISGYTLKNLKGDSFQLPSGSMLKSGIPLRIYTGTGIDASNILYLRQVRGIWDNMADCAILQAANGDTVHEVGYGGARCP